MKDDVLVRQRHLNMTFFSVVLMIITTIQWITLDMNLPALPVLKEEFHTSEGMLNISMNTGIAATAVGTLISGTLADRFGRKRVLLAGLAVSAIGNLACAFAGGIFFLSLMRGIAGLGTGFAEVVTAAMLKDSFTGKRFEKLMTIMQSIAAVGPLFAPTLGSIVINLTSWQGIFLFLGTAIAVTAIPIIISDETWPEESREAENIGQVIREAASIARAPAFSLFLGITALLTIPVWAYIAVSPYIYINDFGLSNTTYGILYGGGSAMSILAPFLYLLIMRRFSGAAVVRVCVAITLASGLTFLLAGRFHPLIFLMAVVPIMLAEGMIRPLSLVVLLEEYSRAAGSASALIQFVVNLVGIIGTTLATLPWHSMISGTGFITLGCGLISLLFWVILRRKSLLESRLG